MSKWSAVVLGASTLLTGAIWMACGLNPQPYPPELDNKKATDAGANTGFESESGTGFPASPDASAADDASQAAGDAGDGGGDADLDADTDGAADATGDGS